MNNVSKDILSDIKINILPGSAAKRILLIASVLLIHMLASGRTYGNTSLQPLDVSVEPGDEFWIDIEVSEVESLFGISFILSYDNKDIVEPLSTETGSFIGDDVLSFPQIDKEAGEVAVGLSRKSGQGGVNGTGIIFRIKFTVSADAPAGSTIILSLEGVNANDPSGESINLWFFFKKAGQKNHL